MACPRENAGLVRCRRHGLKAVTGEQGQNIRSGMSGRRSGFHLAELDTRRRAAMVRQAGAGPDHPVHPLLPESAYLKAIVYALD
jgi:hypothetical protein